MAGRRRIAVGWRPHPHAALMGHGEVPIPDLSARLRVAPHYLAPACLVPSAFYTVLPLSMAHEVEGVEPHALDPVTDPLLTTFAPLRLWRGRQPLHVHGDSMDHLEVRLPIAFDGSGKLDAVILGNAFFRQVTCHLDPGGPSFLELGGVAG